MHLAFALCRFMEKGNEGRLRVGFSTWGKNAKEMTDLRARARRVMARFMERGDEGLLRIGFGCWRECLDAWRDRQNGVKFLARRLTGKWRYLVEGELRGAFNDWRQAVHHLNADNEYSIKYWGTLERAKGLFYKDWVGAGMRRWRKGVEEEKRLGELRGRVRGVMKRFLARGDESLLRVGFGCWLGGVIEVRRIESVRVRCREIIEFVVSGRELSGMKRGWAGLVRCSRERRMVELEEANYAMVMKGYGLVLKGLLNRKGRGMVVGGWSSWRRMVAMVRECEAAEGERVSRIRERAKEIIEYAVGGRELFDKKRAFAALASNARQAEMVELEDANCEMVAKANALVLKGILLRVMSKKMRMAFLSWAYATASLREQVWQKEEKEGCIRERAREIIEFVVSGRDSYNKKRAFIALVSNLRDGMMADFLKEQCIVVSKANALVLKGLLTRKKAALQMAAFSTWSRRTTNLKQQQLRDEQQGEREME